MYTFYDIIIHTFIYNYIYIYIWLKGEMNRSLLMEVESKAYAITQLTNEHNELLLEKDSFVKKSDLLLNKLRSKEDAILESERKLEGMYLYPLHVITYM